MPIQSIQHVLHFRTRKNKQVMQNLERLWQIDADAHTAQDILDALHPWGGNPELRFHNTLPFFIVLCGLMNLIGGAILSTYIPFSLSVLWFMVCCAVAYMIYEPHRPIDDIISHLEMRIKLLKFDVQYNQIPKIIKTPSSDQLFINRLKHYFPLFDRGAEYNEIDDYAATIWTTREGQDFPVLLFRYHYVTELNVPNLDGTRQNVKEIHKDAWGAFVFNISPLGLAISNRRKEFFYPYKEEWYTSDIQINRQVKVFGCKRELIAKRLSPAFTLKVANLFEHIQGDLISHHNEHIMCFVGDRNLFKVRANKPKNGIHNISALRGYLRTLDMPDYEKFKKNMIELIT
ncbi:hypothetical protein [Acinetobacter shaoyimingii]|uniref:hypothetical protein n=1 Tax=Acinetobacter shaoyimingii TaxID=2715164 RepID=UPI001D0E7304|nr:hypothetical protein [Acinetobacter shaoyimingii]